MHHVLFLVASARQDGNTEQIARLTAQGLPEGTGTSWVRLRDYPLPPFEDQRHTTDVYPWPEGAAETLLDVTLAASDIAFVAPVYWYSVPTDLKRYLDEWSAWLRVPGLQFKEQMQDKHFWTIANSAGKPEHAQPMLESLRLCAHYFGARVMGELLGNGSKPGDALNDPAVSAAAQRFFRTHLPAAEAREG
ncbi:flavodoxin family protein [Deinococcus hopiensis]|uniref:Multimeric flavodoxin WrbA n=1 Tax=Deinococcus hopiensis KR-140 TaxID=695939 RepID=A0A1W1UNY4_9DEIO|nr:NAD(P)H-dependent oxidoreductase [Deinococcus hopiensis]SMB82828.1 Multimeric flavodoxin WrbA [Deinococcus hopiensis KR-140]